MTTPYSNSSNFPWALGFAFWPLLGWVGDRPRNVAVGEPVLAHVGPWVSVAFHATGALLATLVHPVWGLAWALFAGLILMRRVCALGMSATPVRFRDVPAVFATAFGHRFLAASGVFAAAFAVTVSTLLGTAPYALGWMQEAIAYLTPVAVIAVAGWAGHVYHAEMERGAAAMRAWGQRFASIFGVSLATVETGHITIRPDAVALTPVHPDVAIKTSVEHRGGIDERIAAISPAWQFDADGLAEGVVRLVPVDEKTLADRAALAATGGRLLAPMETDAQGDEPRRAGFLRFDDLGLQ